MIPTIFGFLLICFAFPRKWTRRLLAHLVSNLESVLFVPKLAAADMGLQSALAPRDQVLPFCRWIFDCARTERYIDISGGFFVGSIPSNSVLL